MKKYEFETDQLPPTQATMYGVWVTLAIGVLAFLAAMLLPGSGQAQSTIRDTVTVEVLCSYPVVTFKGIDGNDHSIRNPAAIFKDAKMERTFEKQFFNPPYKVDPFLGTNITWGWIKVATRYIDLVEVEGCYQLLPLEEK